eukprot:scaffold98235_cov30-Prasinocladus_malaysianus.AAC.1
MSGAVWSLVRAAMEGSSPAMLDVWGAMWEGQGSYAMQPTARRYESYEMSFAAKVGALGLTHFRLMLSEVATHSAMVTCKCRKKRQLQPIDLYVACLRWALESRCNTALICTSR